MKIVLPVHHFPPRYSAGAELYTLRLARWLRAHGHAVEVVAIESIAGAEPLTAVREAYQDLPVWRLTLGAGETTQPLGLGYRSAALRAWFDAYLERSAPDLVHLQAGYLLGIAPLESAAAAAIPTVLTLHDYWFLCPRITLQRGDGTLCRTVPADPAGCAWCLGLEQRRYRYIDQLSAGAARSVVPRLALRQTRNAVAERRDAALAALALPDAVIAPSHFLAAQFAPYVPAARLHLLRYGLDVARYADVAARPSDHTIRFGYLGQIAPHKGVHLLVEAFRRLRPAKVAAELHIYGGLEQDARYTDRLKQLAGGDPRIVFHGRFAHERVVDILSDLDATVVPSQWYENSPLAIMEAHAAGRPVITTALGGMAELVRHDVDGLHFQPGDAGDLAVQLERLVAEPQLLPRLRAGIRAPGSDSDEMAQLTGIYEHVAAVAAVLKA